MREVYGILTICAMLVALLSLPNYDKATFYMSLAIFNWIGFQHSDEQRN